MIWTVKLSSKAEKHYRKLNRGTRERVKKDLIKLSEYSDPLSHQNVKPLTGELRGFYRLRVGDYRIVFSVLKKDNIIAVVNVAPRGDVYK